MEKYEPRDYFTLRLIMGKVFAVRSAGLHLCDEAEMCLRCLRLIFPETEQICDFSPKVGLNEIK